MFIANTTIEIETINNSHQLIFIIIEIILYFVLLLLFNVYFGLVVLASHKTERNNNKKNSEYCCNYVNTAERRVVFTTIYGSFNWTKCVERNGPLTMADSSEIFDRTETKSHRCQVSLTVMINASLIILTSFNRISSTECIDNTCWRCSSWEGKKVIINRHRYVIVLNVLLNVQWSMIADNSFLINFCFPSMHWCLILILILTIHSQSISLECF